MSRMDKYLTKEIEHSHHENDEGATILTTSIGGINDGCINLIDEVTHAVASLADTISVNFTVDPSTLLDSVASTTTVSGMKNMNKSNSNQVIYKVLANVNDSDGQHDNGNDIDTSNGVGEIGEAIDGLLQQATDHMDPLKTVISTTQSQVRTNKQLSRPLGPNTVIGSFANNIGEGRDVIAATTSATSMIGNIAEDLLNTATSHLTTGAMSGVQELLGNQFNPQHYNKEGTKEKLMEMTSSIANNAMSNIKSSKQKLLSIQYPVQDTQRKQPQTQSAKASTSTATSTPGGTTSSVSSSQQARTVSIVKAPNRKTLSHGAFIGTDGHTSAKKGPSCRFVFVSDGWDPDTEEDYLPALFNALGIPVPSVSFVTSRCTHLLPEVGLRLTAASSSSIGGTSSTTVSDANTPSTTNSSNSGSGSDQMEIIEESPSSEEKNFFNIIMNSRMASIMKAISTACVQCDGMYYLTHPYIDNRFDSLIVDNLSPGSVVLTSFSLNSPTLASMKKLILESIVNLNDDITTAIHWGQYTGSSGDQMVDTPYNYSTSLLASTSTSSPSPSYQVLENISHIIVFESEQDHKFFQKAMEKEIPQALCAAGGTTSLLDSSLAAIEAGTPLFIFNHTVRTGYLLARLMKFRNAEDTNVNKHDELRKALYHTDYQRLYELTEDMPDKIIQAAYNFPITYNPNSIFVIDPLKEPNPDKLLDKIMEKQLAVLKDNENRTANFLKSIMIVLTFVTTMLACIIEYTRYERDDPDALQGLTIITIILPICLGICATCFAAFSPISKSALFTLVHARLIQEMYKYRCRVGDYRARTGLGSAHRVAFSNKLKSMWDDIMNSEVMKGSLDIDTKVHPELNQQDSHGFKKATNKANNVHELQPLSSEKYIEERLAASLHHLKRTIPSLSRQIRLLQVGTIIASSAGAMLAAYRLQLWMPILLSFVTVLESIYEYNKMPLRLRCLNIAYSKLKQVIFWWSGLTLIQQRMPQNKLRLVTSVESILYDQVSILVEGDLESKDDMVFTEGTENDAGGDNGGVNGNGGSIGNGLGATSSMQSGSAERRMNGISRRPVSAAAGGRSNSIGGNAINNKNNNNIMNNNYFV